MPPPFEHLAIRLSIILYLTIPPTADTEVRIPKSISHLFLLLTLTRLASVDHLSLRRHPARSDPRTPSTGLELDELAFADCLDPC